MRALALAAFFALPLTACQPADNLAFSVDQLRTDPDARAALFAQIDRRIAAGDPDAPVSKIAIRLIADTALAFEAVRPELERHARNGHAGAAMMLASGYKGYRNDTPDFDEAARWLARAADLGDAEAARELAAYRAYAASGAKTRG